MKKCLALGLLAGTCLVVGCAGNDASFESVRSNPTPELMTLNGRPVDVEKNMAYQRNVNWRLMWEDWGRVWYTDHPSRLSPTRVPYTSGKPR